MNQPPLTDGRAVSRLLDHCARLPGIDSRPQARERLEERLGSELTHRLVRALSGDHRVPARLFVA